MVETRTALGEANAAPGPLCALSRVLVATDLSARSDRAVERAVNLAKQTGAALTIVHVVDTDLPSRIADRLYDDARALIADHVSTLQDDGVVAPDIRVVFGRDYNDIVDLAEKTGAELIVLGVHRNETRELFRGTTAERVIRTGASPVLLVKMRPRSSYHRIIVGVDFSEYSRRAIQFATKLFPKGAFHLVHAFDVPFKAFLTSDNNRREASKDHQEQMGRFVEEDIALRTILQAAPARLVQVVRQGPARQVIRDQVDRLKPDLLVLGTRGRSGIAHAVVGSVAEDFLSHPPCDVLAVCL